MLDSILSIELVYCPACRFPVKQVDGRYRLLKKLGAGGFGVVYQTEDRLDPATPIKAIKFLKHNLSMDSSVFERFRREMEITAEVSKTSPHIVQIFEQHGYDTALGHYYVMEHVEGMSLRDMMRQKELSLSVIIEVITQLCDVLSHIHEHGIAHRDLKPENILLNQHEDNSVSLILLDFGIAKRVNEETKHALTNGALGSPDYMAPEQCTGLSIDERVDQYAVATLLYEMLTGQHPLFSDPEAPSVDLFSKMNALLKIKPTSLKEHSPLFSSGLDRVMGTALSKRPEARFESIREFKEKILPHLQICNTLKPQTREIPLSSPVSKPLPLGETNQQWWIGHRRSEALIFQNSYLQLFRESTHSNRFFSLIVDPGNEVDLNIMLKKAQEKLGSLSRLSAIFLSHQEPDVAASTTTLLHRYAPQARILCTQATWRMVRHYNLPKDRFVCLDKYLTGLNLPTGHTLIPIPSPFCHFAGAIMLYCPEQKTLYSGDLFSSLTLPGLGGMWADESDWVGMRAFHQLHMPSRKAILHTLRSLSPFLDEIEVIAPQHGRWIQKPWIKMFVERLRSLPMSLDLLFTANRTHTEQWKELFGSILSTLKTLVPSTFFLEMKKHPLWEQALQWSFDLEEAPTSISEGKWLVEQVLFLIRHNTPHPLYLKLIGEVLEFCEQEGMPTPRLSLAAAARQTGETTLVFDS
jgi:serine/threonine-protein kinase